MLLPLNRFVERKGKEDNARIFLTAFSPDKERSQHMIWSMLLIAAWGEAWLSMPVSDGDDSPCLHSHFIYRTNVRAWLDTPILCCLSYNFVEQIWHIKSHFPQSLNNVWSENFCYCHSSFNFTTSTVIILLIFFSLLWHIYL